MINYLLKLDKFTWISILLNVLAFMVIQTTFFLLVASNQYENVLKSKISFITDLGNENDSVKQEIEMLKQNSTELKEKAEASAKIRNQLNRELTIKYCVIPITVVFVIFISLILFVKSGRKWQPKDTFNVSLILLAYVTELYFFFFIVQKYQFIGDHYIFYNTINNAEIKNKVPQTTTQII